jgi:hypothetical protein
MLKYQDSNPANKHKKPNENPRKTKKHGSFWLQNGSACGVITAQKGFGFSCRSTFSGFEKHFL